MTKLFLFGVLALIFLVQAPFVFAYIDLCENVSHKYEDLCYEIVDADLGYDETIDLIEHIDEVEYYTPTPESRFEKNYCQTHDCAIPAYSRGDFDYSKLNLVLYGISFLLVFYLIFRLTKKYGDRVWHLVAS